jgi:hypothetical protein
MNYSRIVYSRFHHQQICETKFRSPAELTQWMGAIQSQDFGMSKWAIGMRLPGFTNSKTEAAFNKGEIIRTHVLRPTWHFVAPADIRWMLQLTGPRIHAANGFMQRKVEVDAKLIAKSNDVLAAALEGGKFLMRNELQEALAKKKIKAETLRLVYLLMAAELDGVICSGPRIGKQFSYALLDERVPTVKTKFTREEAMHELAKRYFASHGPATAADFAWWSGFTQKDAKAAVNSLPSSFRKETIEGSEYFALSFDLPEPDPARSTFLMADYDEYAVSYKDRSAIAGEANLEGEKASGNLLFYHNFVLEGKIAGTWSFSDKNKKSAVALKPLAKLSIRQKKLLDDATSRCLAFYAG